MNATVAILFIGIAYLFETCIIVYCLLDIARAIRERKP